MSSSYTSTNDTSNTNVNTEENKIQNFYEFVLSKQYVKKIITKIDANGNTLEFTSETKDVDYMFERTPKVKFINDTNGISRKAKTKKENDKLIYDEIFSETTPEKQVAVFKKFTHDIQDNLIRLWINSNYISDITSQTKTLFIQEQNVVEEKTEEFNQAVKSGNSETAKQILDSLSQDRKNAVSNDIQTSGTITDTEKEQANNVIYSDFDNLTETEKLIINNLRNNTLIQNAEEFITKVVNNTDEKIEIIYNDGVLNKNVIFFADLNDRKYTVLTSILNDASFVEHMNSNIINDQPIYVDINKICRRFYLQDIRTGGYIFKPADNFDNTNNVNLFDIESINYNNLNTPLPLNQKFIKGFNISRYQNEYYISRIKTLTKVPLTLLPYKIDNDGIFISTLDEVQRGELVNVYDKQINITKWYDKSGHNNNFILENGYTPGKLIQNRLNGMPSVKFSGTSFKSSKEDLTKRQSIINDGVVQSFYFFAVIKGNVDNNYLFYFNDEELDRTNQSMNRSKIVIQYPRKDFKFSIGKRGHPAYQQVAKYYDNDSTGRYDFIEPIVTTNNAELDMSLNLLNYGHETFNNYLLISSSRNHTNIQSIYKNGVKLFDRSVYNNNSIWNQYYHPTLSDYQYSSYGTFLTFAENDLNLNFILGRDCDIEICELIIYMHTWRSVDFDIINNYLNKKWKFDPDNINNGAPDNLDNYKDNMFLWLDSNDINADNSQESDVNFITIDNKDIVLPTEKINSTSFHFKTHNTIHINNSSSYINTLLNGISNSDTISSLRNLKKTILLELLPLSIGTIESIKNIISQHSNYTLYDNGSIYFTFEPIFDLIHEISINTNVNSVIQNLENKTPQEILNILGRYEFTQRKTSPTIFNDYLYGEIIEFALKQENYYNKQWVIDYLVYKNLKLQQFNNLINIKTTSISLELTEAAFNGDFSNNIINDIHDYIISPNKTSLTPPYNKLTDINIEIGNLIYNNIDNSVEIDFIVHKSNRPDDITSLEVITLINDNILTLEKISIITALLPNKNLIYQIDYASTNNLTSSLILTINAHNDVSEGVSDTDTQSDIDSENNLITETIDLLVNTIHVVEVISSPTSSDKDKMETILKLPLNVKSQFTEIVDKVASESSSTLATIQTQSEQIYADAILQRDYINDNISNILDKVKYWYSLSLILRKQVIDIQNNKILPIAIQSFMDPEHILYEWKDKSSNNNNFYLPIDDPLNYENNMPVVKTINTPEFNKKMITFEKNLIHNDNNNLQYMYIDASNITNKRSDDGTSVFDTNGNLYIYNIVYSEPELTVADTSNSNLFFFTNANKDIDRSHIGKERDSGYYSRDSFIGIRQRATRGSMHVRYNRDMDKYYGSFIEASVGSAGKIIREDVNNNYATYLSEIYIDQNDKEVGNNVFNSLDLIHERAVYLQTYREKTLLKSMGTHTSFNDINIGNNNLFINDFKETDSEGNEIIVTDKSRVLTHEPVISINDISYNTKFYLGIDQDYIRRLFTTTSIEKARGNIGEFMIFTEELSREERESIHAFLNTKWNLSNVYDKFNLSRLNTLPQGVKNKLLFWFDSEDIFNTNVNISEKLSVISSALLELDNFNDILDYLSRITFNDYNELINFFNNDDASFNIFLSNNNINKDDFNNIKNLFHHDKNLIIYSYYLLNTNIRSIYDNSYNSIYLNISSQNLSNIINNINSIKSTIIDVNNSDSTILNTYNSLTLQEKTILFDYVLEDTYKDKLNYIIYYNDSINAINLLSIYDKGPNKLKLNQTKGSNTSTIIKIHNDNVNNFYDITSRNTSIIRSNGYEIDNLLVDKTNHNMFTFYIYGVYRFNSDVTDNHQYAEEDLFFTLLDYKPIKQKIHNANNTSSNHSQLMIRKTSNQAEHRIFLHRRTFRDKISAGNSENTEAYISYCDLSDGLQTSDIAPDTENDFRDVNSYIANNQLYYSFNKRTSINSPDTKLHLFELSIDDRRKNRSSTINNIRYLGEDGNIRHSTNCLLSGGNSQNTSISYFNQNIKTLDDPDDKTHLDYNNQRLVHEWPSRNTCLFGENMDIAEVLIFHEPLSNDEHYIINKYLINKWKFNNNFTHRYCPRVLFKNDDINEIINELPDTITDKSTLWIDSTDPCNLLYKAPNVYNLNYNTNEDTAITLDLSSNILDASLNEFTFQIHKSPDNGTIVFHNTISNQVTYTPNNNYYGLDYFTYTAYNNITKIKAKNANVYINVIPINDIPTCIDINLNIDLKNYYDILTPINITLIGNDKDISFNNTLTRTNVDSRITTIYDKTYNNNLVVENATGPLYKIYNISNIQFNAIHFEGQDRIDPIYTETDTLSDLCYITKKFDNDPFLYSIFITFKPSRDIHRYNKDSFIGINQVIKNEDSSILPNISNFYSNNGLIFESTPNGTFNNEILISLVIDNNFSGIPRKTNDTRWYIPSDRFVSINFDYDDTLNKYNGYYNNEINVNNIYNDDNDNNNKLDLFKISSLQLNNLFRRYEDRQLGMTHTFDIGEIIIFNQQLTQQERNNVADYLNKKWYTNGDYNDNNNDVNIKLSDPGNTIFNKMELWIDANSIDNIVNDSISYELVTHSKYSTTTINNNVLTYTPLSQQTIIDNIANGDNTFITGGGITDTFQYRCVDSNNAVSLPKTISITHSKLVDLDIIDAFVDNVQDIIDDNEITEFDIDESVYKIYIELDTLSKDYMENDDQFDFKYKVDGALNIINNINSQNIQNKITDISNASTFNDQLTLFNSYTSSEKDTLLLAFMDETYSNVNIIAQFIQDKNTMHKTDIAENNIDYEFNVEENMYHTFIKLDLFERDLLVEDISNSSFKYKTDSLLLLNNSLDTSSNLNTIINSLSLLDSSSAKLNYLNTILDKQTKHNVLLKLLRDYHSNKTYNLWSKEIFNLEINNTINDISNNIGNDIEIFKILVNIDSVIKNLVIEDISNNVFNNVNNTHIATALDYFTIAQDRTSFHIIDKIKNISGINNRLREFKKIDDLRSNILINYMESVYYDQTWFINMNDKLNSNILPVASNIDIYLYPDNSYNITLVGTDIEDGTDNVDLEYYITQYPTYGTIKNSSSEIINNVINKNNNIILDSSNIIYYASSSANFDTFKYIVRDSFGDYSLESTVSISVIGQTLDLSFSVYQDISLNIEIPIPNGYSNNSLNFEYTGTNINGILDIPFYNNTITYTPNTGYFGNISFDYIGKDTGSQTILSGKIDIEVKENEKPHAKDISINFIQNSNNNFIQLKGFDSFDGSNVVYKLVTLPTHGLLYNNVNGTQYTNSNIINTLNDNSVYYTPTTNYLGNDTFTYNVIDEHGLVSDNAIVDISVNTNVLPEVGLISKNIITIVNISSVFNLLPLVGINNDNTGTQISTPNFVKVTEPTNGHINIMSNKMFYTPNTDFTGIDTFKYNVNDGTNSSPDSNVTIIVQWNSELANNDTQINI
mgnify:CR=1 FL=1